MNVLSEMAVVDQPSDRLICHDKFSPPKDVTICPVNANQIEAMQGLLEPVIRKPTGIEAVDDQLIPPTVVHYLFVEAPTNPEKPSGATKLVRRPLLTNLHHWFAHVAVQADKKKPERTTTTFDKQCDLFRTMMRYCP